MRHFRVLPEDHVEWTQYRFLPIPRLYMKLDERWLDIGGWSDFDIQDGYQLDAPQAIPSGCQARGDGFFGVANVDREWEARAEIDATIDEILLSLKLDKEKQ